MNDETVVAIVVFGGIVVCFLAFLFVKSGGATTAQASFSRRELERYGIQT